MKQEPQTGKRIVSKGRYVVTIGQKAVMSFSGLSLYLTGLLGLAFCLVLLLFACSDIRFLHLPQIAILGMFTALSAGTLVFPRICGSPSLWVQ